MEAEATAAREQGWPHCIVAESVICGRCHGQGELTWVRADGSIVSYAGRLQGTAACLALMHGHVSSPAFSPCRTPEHSCPSLRFWACSERACCSSMLGCEGTKPEPAPSGSQRSPSRVPRAAFPEPRSLSQPHYLGMSRSGNPPSFRPSGHAPDLWLSFPVCCVAGRSISPSPAARPARLRGQSA